MKKLKFFMVGISAIFVLGIPILNNTDSNLEAATSTFSAPALSINNKVKVANKTYTVIGTGDNVKLLADASEGDSLTWNDAQAKLTDIPASYGALANTILTNKFTQPTTTDLASFKVGDALNSSIPTLTNNWWLGDASVDNRSKYLAANNNSYIGKNKIEDTATEGATCTTKETEEIGILPTVDEVGEAEKPIIDYDKIEMKIDAVDAIDLDTNLPFYNSDLGNPKGSAYVKKDCTRSTTGDLMQQEIRRFYPGYVGKSIITILKNGDLVADYLNSDLYSVANNIYDYYFFSVMTFNVMLDAYARTGPTNFIPKVGDEYEMTYSKDVCIEREMKTGDFGVEGGNEVEFPGFYTFSAYSYHSNLYAKVRIDDVTYIGPIYGTACPGQLHPAGTASLRPMITLPNSQILFNNTSKREYPSVTKIESGVPTSNDKGSFLTLLSTDLEAKLDQSNDNVNDNVLTVAYDGTMPSIKIPVTIKDKKEGTSYVSVSAKDNKGKDVYGVLGRIDGTEGTVTLNISNLVKTDSDYIDLTLYQEDSGTYNTAYMSEGTPIKIKLLKPQNIAVDDEQATSMTYGETVTITSSLTSDPMQQADTAIIYTIAPGLGVVETQSYDKDTGKATATIKATSGTGKIAVSLVKAGSDTVAEATAVHGIELKKKDLTIYPTKPTKIYTVGETMPALTSTNIGLLSGDTLPSEIAITLEPLAGTEAALPATSGKIDAVGKWKMTYASGVLPSIPEVFKNKYNIILKDYAIDRSYVFETKGKLKLDAQLQAINPEDSKTQDILVTREGAEAGITSFKVYHSVDDGTYVELADLSQVTNPLTYVAKMNGYYKFELVDKLNETVTSKVQVSEVTPPMPNTIIKAVLADGKNTPYVINTWTNEKVVLTLSNGNAEIKDTVTWEVQTKDSSTWESVVGNTYEVDTATWIKGQYSFRGTSSLGAVESVASVMNVNIDKVKPSLPSISNEAQYKEETIFDENVTMEGSVVAKESGINQNIYYKIGATGTWELMIANQLLIETNGKHEVSFKVVDDAGNESDVKGPLVVHLNKTTPTISFKLNDKALNFWLNKVTFGYFFKETVAVEISSDTPADIWYIVDTSETQTMPLNSDLRWFKGTTTNIEPDKKAIIYAKAVTNAGKESISSTTYYVYADKTNPNITFEANENWTNETDLEVTINDALSGIDDKTVTYSAKDVVNEKVSVVNGKVKLTLVDGEYDVVVKGNDHSGNEATGTTRVKIDTANPVIKDVKGNTTGWANSRTIALHASDALSGLAVGYPKVTGEKGPVTVVNDGSGKYHFIISANGSYSIEVKDQAGNTATSTYVEDKIGEDQSGLQVLAESAGESIASTEWTKEDVSFKIGGGSISNPVTGYQVAITSGTQPQESDWNTLSDPTNNKHLVSSEQRSKSFYFRSLPDKVTSTAFVVNIDKTAPTNVAITLSKKNSGPMARMFNLMSFGNWLKEEQAVSLSATDNLSSASELKMYYAEEKNGVMGQWKLDSKTLSYRDVDIKLHAKAVDLAGNESVASEIVQIDLLPPTILGVKDQSVYKQYYLPRFIGVSDSGSGLKSASYTKDEGVSIPIDAEVEITGVGEYLVEVEDNAGNTTSITFKIVPLPDLEDIDGSDESKEIIDQIQKELDEIKDKIDEEERSDYEEWLKDANEKWDSLRKTIIENDDKTSKVEGVGDTNFDPKVELIVEPVEESTLPKLPRKALYSYDVYLRKGMTIIQPNGDVKVYLPYPDKADPIVYEIGKVRTIREIPAQKEGDSVVFVTRVLQKYAISNVEQEQDEVIKVPGPDGDLDTDDDVIANPNDKGDLPVKNPDGSVTLPNGGSVTYPNDKVIQTPDGGKLLPDGSLILPDGTEYDPEGNLKPEPKPEVDKDLNIDSDGDGKPDVNVDVDCDGKADINIDTNNDGIPNINIDTTGDGKPNYNVDLDGDKKADLNIGPIRWKTDKCVSGGCVLYCTSTFYKPYLNIDSDGDMRPDVNVDLDKDNFADINIDIDLDLIPDIDIDSDGDGKADINVDTNDDGRPDKNLALMSKWVPDKNVDAPIAYDTMSGIVVDETLTPDTWHPSNKGNVSNDGNTNDGNSNTGGIGGSNTGDATSTIAVWILFIISGCMSYVMHRIKKQQKRKFR